MWAQRLNQLTESQRQDIWLRADEGSSLTQLSKRYGVSLATISRIVSDRRQRRNVIAVPDESVLVEVAVSKDGSQQPQEQPSEAQQGGSPERVLLAEGRKRKPVRAST